MNGDRQLPDGRAGAEYAPLSPVEDNKRLVQTHHAVHAARDAGEGWRTRWLFGEWIQQVLETPQYTVSSVEPIAVLEYDKWLKSDRWRRLNEPPPVLENSWHAKENDAADCYDLQPYPDDVRALEHIASGIRIVADTDWFAVAAEHHSKFVELCIAEVQAPPYLRRTHDDAALDSVVWDAQTRNLVRDVKFFANNAAWFQLRGLPYKRSYLLFGPPGNGKTSSIRAVADYLHLDFDTYDLCSPHSTDEEFIEWLTKGSRRNRLRELFDLSNLADVEPLRVKRVLVLEDIDRFFEADGARTGTRVSKSALLNGLDGAIPIHEAILFATANHPENLDQTVVTRPGRFDLRVHYNPPDIDHAMILLSALFKHDAAVTPVGLHKACTAMAGHSYALHKSVLAVSGSIASVADPCGGITDEHLAEAVEVVLDGAQVLHGSRKVGF